MEIDQEKEIDVADQLVIDDLPNEILLTIFRNLSYRQLVHASAVNHRWNELAFFLLQNRVSLRLDAWLFEPDREWIRNRTYRAVSFRSDLYKGFDLFALHLLAEDVRKVEITCADAADVALLDFLRHFREVETLVVNIDRLRLLKSPESFLRKSRQLLRLDSVRHLTLRCRYVRLAGLMANVAPRLVTLDVELVARLLPSFYECRFECLQSLALRFKLAKVVHTWSLRGKQELIECLRKVTTLRKFGLFVDTDIRAYEVAFALPAIEELTLGGRFKRPWAEFYNLSQMSNLRSLSLEIKAEQFYMTGFSANPLPTVETFRTNKTAEIPLPAVITTFPNLKVLFIDSTIIPDSAVQSIVGSTWQNTMEDLTLTIASIKPTVISSFVFLQSLKRLCLFCCDDATDGLSSFNAIASMRTMKELHISRLRGGQWWQSAAELGDCNPACSVRINNMPAKFYKSALQ